MRVTEQGLITWGPIAEGVAVQETCIVITF